MNIPIELVLLGVYLTGLVYFIYDLPYLQRWKEGRRIIALRDRYPHYDLDYKSTWPLHYHDEHYHLLVFIWPLIIPVEFIKRLLRRW